MGMIYSTDKLRNVILTAHGGVGKTSLAEGILFATGLNDRLGKVAEGNTLMDFNPDEIDRKSSINLSLAYCEWNKHKINILDTPGYSDFYGDTIAAMHVADGALMLINAASGVEVGTEILWGYLQERGLPTIIVINTLDKENINLDRTIDQVKEFFKKTIIQLQVPYGTGDKFKGIIDVLNDKYYEFSDKSDGKCTEKPMPGDADYSMEKDALIEAAAESDDALLEKFFEGSTLTLDEIKSGLRKGIHSCKIIPIMFSIAIKNVGTLPILDAIVEYLPSPAQMPAKLKNGNQLEVNSNGKLAGLVFKTMSEPHIGELSFVKVYSGVIEPGQDIFNITTDHEERIGQVSTMVGKKRMDLGKIVAGDIGTLVKLKYTHTNNILCEKGNDIELAKIDFPMPVIDLAVVPRNKGDEDKIGGALHHLHEEDLTFNIVHDKELRQTIIKGRSEIHLEVIINRMKRRYGVEVDITSPRIPYRETLKGKSKVSYRHKKQSGGAGQFGEVYFYMDHYEDGAPTPGEFTFRGEEIDDLPWGGRLRYVNAIVGGAIDGKFIPAVKKGIMEAMQGGVMAGYPVIDVRVILHDGKMHPVDSNENAFKTAGRMAFKKGFNEARPMMLEPIYSVRVIVPEEYMGDVMGDLSSRRGKIQGMESQGKSQIIRAMVPLAELDKYSTSLRSMTQGRGIFVRDFSHYEEVPHEIAEKLKIDQEEEE